MNVSDFDYNLPDELIAQTPLLKRDDCLLMIVDRFSGEIIHKKFSDIINYFNKGDVLVINDTKVMPARLFGVKEETLANIEILILSELEKDVFECLVKPAKRVTVGTIVRFSGKLSAKCLKIKDEGIRVFEFIYDGILLEILEELGEMPLPPYIYEKLEDKNMYQTVYANDIGSAAAPTAGLHFTNLLLEKIKSKGVTIVSITLHVGLGTFRPVSVDKIENHKMHFEFYCMSREVSEILNNSVGRIIGVGTTSVRALETVKNLYGEFKECSGVTDIFISPGYEFKAIDCMITNFHLPKSTLMMLISAFSSRDIIMSAYMEAIKSKYRFFSFGDSMFITNFNKN